MRARGATEIKVRQEEREAVKNHHVFIPPLRAAQPLPKWRRSFVARV